MCVGSGVNGQAEPPEREPGETKGGEDTPLPLPERVPCIYSEVRRVRAMDDMAILLRVKAGLEGL